MAYQEWLEDYIPINERIIKMYSDYPDARIVTDVIELTDTRVTFRARVYRTPDYPVPTTGHSYMTIPGTTHFTRGAELENTETSAVGRAIALMGYEVKKSIASRDEVASKQVEEGYEPASVSPKRNPASASKTITEKQVGLLRARTLSSQYAPDQVVEYCQENFGCTPDQITMDQLDTVLDWLQS